MAWNDLSVSQRSQLMNMFRRNGVYSLSDMKRIYDAEFPSEGQEDWGNGVAPVYAQGGKIHIKPSKRGTFTAAAKKHKKSVQQFAAQVLANKGKYSPTMVKKANFARNASKWKHEDGGYLYAGGGLLDKIRKAFAPSYETDTFKEAFRAARNNGDEYFKWNGNRYSTEMKPTVYVKDKRLNIPGLTRAQKKAMEDTWNYMRSNNVSARNTAALMGNAMQESSFNPSAVQSGGDKAVGYFQMHGQRLKDYIKWLEETNNTDSPERQVDYILEVTKGNRPDFYMNDYNRVVSRIDALENSTKRTSAEDTELRGLQDYHSKVYAKREKDNTLYPIADLSEAYEDESMPLEDFTKLFTNTIERPGKPEHQSRGNYARQIYNYFYGVPTVKK